MLIDSHCHLPKEHQFVEGILSRAQAENVGKLICIGTESAENVTAIELANKYSEIYAVIGIFPQSEIHTDINDLTKLLEKQLTLSTSIVGIGECGMDIVDEMKRSEDAQVELFEMQILLAIKHKLPIVIHNRNGNEHVRKLIKKYMGQLYGVAHCFDGDWELAKAYLDCGFYISFSGFVTFKSKNYLLDSVNKVPIDRILIETDSPYIVPKNIKEKQNEPKNVRIVAQKIADVRQISINEVEESTYHNTCRLFKL